MLAGIAGFESPTFAAIEEANETAFEEEIETALFNSRVSAERSRLAAAQSRIAAGAESQCHLSCTC